MYLVFGVTVAPTYWSPVIYLVEFVPSCKASCCVFGIGVFCALTYWSPVVYLVEFVPSDKASCYNQVTLDASE